MAENIRPELIDIPGYRFQRWLGRGGMADVYLATQLSLGRPVAIKVLASERAPSEEVSARFEQEARIVARLDHPNIVGIFDVGRTPGGLLYYTMPYMPGGDLATRDLTRDQQGVIDVTRALCQALLHAHEHSIVHRDVKPENVLYDQSGRPRLADFGIAFTSLANTRVTKEGSTLGSVAYMSPEQARGRAVDQRSDIYSLGCVCYECLTGKLPFSGQDSMSMALAHVEQPVPRLPSARRHWQSFIDKAMAKKPDDRFQSASEMLAALDALERRIVLVAPVNALASTLAEVPHQLKHGLRVPLRARASGVAILLVAVLSVSAYSIYRFRAVPAAQEAAPVQGMAPVDSVAQIAVPQVPAGPASDSALVAASPESTIVEATSTTEQPAQSIAAAPSPDPLVQDEGAPEMVFVPAQLQHGGKTFAIAHAFALGRNEITRGEYAEFVRATARASASCRQSLRLWSVFEKLSWRSPGFAQDDRHPVVCVSWNDANAYASWLSKRTHHHYRLPSQAEWVHAARPQSDNASVCKHGNIYDASNRTILHMANRFDCNDGFAQTAPVGRFVANTLAIHDLLGNASEWTRDCVARKSGRKSAENAPCSERIFRGTSWRDGSDRHNLEFSGSEAPDVGFTTVGFRIARDFDDNEAAGNPEASARR